MPNMEKHHNKKICFFIMWLQHAFVELVQFQFSYFLFSFFYWRQSYHFRQLLRHWSGHWQINVALFAGYWGRNPKRASPWCQRHRPSHPHLKWSYANSCKGYEGKEEPTPEGSPTLSVLIMKSDILCKQMLSSQNSCLHLKSILCPQRRTYVVPTSARRHSIDHKDRRGSRGKPALLYNFSVFSPSTLCSGQIRGPDDVTDKLSCKHSFPHQWLPLPRKKALRFKYQVCLSHPKYTKHLLHTCITRW